MYQNSVYHTFAEFLSIWQNRGFIVKGHILKISWWHLICDAINFVSILWYDQLDSMISQNQFWNNPISYCKQLNYVLGKMANVFLLLKIMSLLKNAITWYWFYFILFYFISFVVPWLSSVTVLAFLISSLDFLMNKFVSCIVNHYK